MRPLLAAVAAAVVLLAGCSDPPAADVPEEGAQDDVVAGVLAKPEPMRFATGDYEGAMAGTSTFSIAQQAVQLPGFEGGEDIIDLTSIIPAGAPVELNVQVHMANADLEFVEAYALGTEAEDFGEFDGQATNFAVIVTRGDTGKVLLHVYNPGGFNEVPPNAAPTADWEAASVVRASVLVPGVPASVRLQAGDALELPGSGIEELVVVAPDGLVRDAEAPFNFTAPAAGEYTLLLAAAEASPVLGPSVTMTARRIELVAGDVHPLQSGAETTWTQSIEGTPLLVGVEVHETKTVSVFGVALFATQLEVRMVAPDAVTVVDENANCDPICGPAVFANGFTFTFHGEPLDAHLAPGDYAVAIAYTGNGFEAFAWSIHIV